MALPITFQATIASTGVPQALPNNSLIKGGMFAAKTGNNAAGIAIGNGATDSATTGYLLLPATNTPFIPFQRNTNSFYIEGTSGDVLSFLGS
jgi:hypothetical protein